MSPPDLDALLGQVRDLTAQYQVGSNPDSFHAFRDLLQLLLGQTILDQSGAVQLFSGPRRAPVLALGGWAGPDDPLPLTDGLFLRMSMTLFFEETDQGPRVKVKSSSFQYQLDRRGGTDRWVFRYDYLREPPDPHPSAHLHVRGTLTESCLPEGQLLERLHFPTQRVSLEAVIRLLIEQFGVPPNTPAAVWRRILAESEAAFYAIAHRGLSGPDQ